MRKTIFIKWKEYSQRNRKRNELLGLNKQLKNYINIGRVFRGWNNFIREKAIRELENAKEEREKLKVQSYYILEYHRNNRKRKYKSI